MSAIIAKTTTPKTRTHVVNIKSYGAKIDGVTNDLPAIQAAINSITTGTVILPAGTIRIDGTIVLKDGITLEGQGSDVTTIVLGSPFFSASTKIWTSYSAIGDVIRDNVTNNRVIICLSGGASTHPSNSQVYIKNITLKPVTSPASIYGVTGIYGSLIKSGVDNVSTSYLSIGALVGLFSSEFRGSGSLSYGNIGIKLLSSIDALIQKTSLTFNKVSIDIVNNSYNIDIQNVNFTGSNLALRVGPNCGNINVSTPTLTKVENKPWLIHPSSRVNLPNKEDSSQFYFVNTAVDGYLQESAVFLETEDSGVEIKKVLESPDPYLKTAAFTGKKRLYIDPGENEEITLTTTSQKFGVIDWQFHAKNTARLRLNVETEDTTIVYDSGWIYGLLTLSGIAGTLPNRIFGSLLDEDHSENSSPYYTIKVFYEGDSPFFIDKLSMHEATYVYNLSDFDYTIETISGMHVYNWSNASPLGIDLGYNKNYKAGLSLFAKAKEYNSSGTFQIFAGPDENNLVSSFYYENGEYQFFDFSFITSGSAVFQISDDSTLSIFGLCVYKYEDAIDGIPVMSGAPTVGWWPLGSKVLSSVPSGNLGWTCSDNTSFPNTFRSSNSESILYTWSGTHLGIKNDSESTYTYTDLSGPALEYSWSGTSLGVRVEGSNDAYVYQDLGGISGLQGATGATGATGTPGVSGKDLEYTWSGTSLGVRVSGIGSYVYTDLKGNTGAIGPSGVKGPMGSGLLYEWAGTSLGVKTFDELVYTYTDLIGDSLDFTWSGTSLGVRNSSSGIYSYQNLAGISGLQGPTGPTGPIGATGISAVYGNITASNGWIFHRDTAGSYNISATVIFGEFYRDGDVIGDYGVEVRQLNNQLYEYIALPGLGEAITYSFTRDTAKTTANVSFTHVDTGTTVSQSVLLTKDGSWNTVEPSTANNFTISGIAHITYPSGIKMRSVDNLKDFWLYISNSGGAGYQLYIQEI